MAVPPAVTVNHKTVNHETMNHKTMNPIMMTPADIARIDREHIWHPYSSTTDPIATYPVSHAEGVHLHLADGRRLIDGMSSWWSAIHGYNHPVLNQAARDQLDRFAHVMFGGLTHEPAAQLVATLVDLTPGQLKKVFLCDSGSVSVEVAMKMAVQYWQARGKPGKHRFLSLRNGYHGDTFGAMSVCDPITGMHHLFSQVLTPQVFADSPACRFDEPCTEADIAPFKTLIENHHHELAAAIVEPIVQGAGGMHFYSPDYLRQVRQLCDAHGVLLIADEIATGFGRTGKLFACEWAGIAPDILCLGKALTGGYLTLAATLCSDDVSATICGGEAGVFMHGPTFMGNPLACALANASLGLLIDGDWQQQVARIESGLRVGLAPAAANPRVAEVRVLGAIGVVEMTAPVDLAAITPAFVDAGIWVRPFGRLVYLMPPFIIDDEELATLCAALVRVLAQ